MMTHVRGIYRRTQWKNMPLILNGETVLDIDALGKASCHRGIYA